MKCKKFEIIFEFQAQTESKKKNQQAEMFLMNFTSIQKLQQR